VEQDELGGEFGHYSARLTPTGTVETLSQSVSTTPNQHYTVNFSVAGDAEASGSFFSASWDGQTLLGTSTLSPGFTRYTFDVVGDQTDFSSALEFSYGTDGSGLLVDGVSVSPATGPATETADGSIQFADVETADTQPRVLPLSQAMSGRSRSIRSAKAAGRVPSTGISASPIPISSSCRRARP
jgi:hypothetical protein